MLALDQPDLTKSCVYEEITRYTAGKKLNPPVKERTIQTYLNILRNYLPEFYRFTDKSSGKLNGKQKLTLECVPTLQEVSDYIREYGKSELKIKLASNPQYFSRFRQEPPSEDTGCLALAIIRDEEQVY